jgi:hypothetical protein
MAPLKCNYTIFTSDKSSDANIDIKLFNTKIAINEETTFLSIRFDRHLSFKNLHLHCYIIFHFIKIYMHPDVFY